MFLVSDLLIFHETPSRCFDWPNTCTTNSFQSPNYPNTYNFRYNTFYQLYIPSATSITLTFDNFFQVEESDKDDLYIGTGLALPDDIFSFNGSTDGFPRKFAGMMAPLPQTLDSDTIWILFATDKNIEFGGWRVTWTAGKFWMGWVFIKSKVFY